MAQTSVLTDRPTLQTIDALKYDPLKDDALRGDPLGKGNRKGVDPYYKDIGVAMHPNQRAAYDAQQSAYAQDISQRQGLLAQYSKDTEAQIAAADKQAQGILAKARGQVSQAVGSVPKIRRTGFTVANGNNVEATYSIDQRYADEMFNRLNKMGAKVHNNGDGSYSINVQGYGKEVHSAFRELLQETEKNEQLLREQQDAIRRQGGSELRQLQGDIGAQRKAAVEKRDAEISMAQEQIAELERRKLQITKDLQANFQRARQQNTAGINQLIESGVLVKTATVSGGRQR